jgi:hypothetical protein
MPNLRKLIWAVLAAFFLGACSKSSNVENGGASTGSSGNWDSMNWDQGNWS